MIRSLLRGMSFALMLLFLAGCSNPESPREVTEAFWQSVTENDAGEVVGLSTLTTSSQFDGFDTDWQAISIEWGRIVIDDSRATVETRFVKAGDGESRKILTFLERTDGEWKVDYERTHRAVTERSVFADVMGTLSNLSDRLSASITRSSDSASERLDELAAELEVLAAEAEKRSREALERYGEKLQQHIEELTESIDEALKEEPDASPRDRQLLEASRQDLSRQRARLDEPDLRAFAESSRTVAQTRFRLTELDKAGFEDYRNDWQEGIEEIEGDLSELMDEMNAGRR